VSMDQPGGGQTPPPSPPPQAPPPQQSWQSTPQPPASPPPAGGMATAAPMPPGPLANTTIADFMTRLVAFIIDAVILGVVNYIVWAVLGGLLFSLGGLAIVLHGVIVAAISAGYFIYMWTTRRQTVGMMLMKLMVVQDGSGAALTQSQAIRRWLYLGLPYALSTLLSVTGFGSLGLLGFGGLAILFTLALLVAIVSLGWEIYLAYATNQDARKQGPHDKAAGSVVISYGPSPFAGAGR
jgi:uncharacterized RDD family membrane protein YckC